MANVGDIFLRLLLDDSDFEQQVVQRAQKAGDKAGQSMGAQLAAGLSKSSTQIGKTLANVGQNLTKTGKSLTTNVTLPILAAGGATAKLALDFDTTFRQIEGLAKVPADEIEGLKQKILDLGGKVGRSPQELAEAFYFVASAGFEANEAMEVLETSAKAAASGMGQTQDIAKVLGSVINAYGHENISAADAADQLTAAIQDGSAEAADFAGVIGRVAPTAAALNVSFDQVTAALAGMTNVGLSAEESATSLVQVFNSLIKPTSEAEQTLADMGLSAAGLRQQIKDEGLLAVLRTLQERFAGNDEAAAKVFGNIRALRGVTSLLSLDTEQLNGIFGDTADSLGALQGAYDATEGPQREIDRAMADLQATAIELGQDVLPIVVDILHGLADGAKGVAKWWRSLDDGMKKNIVQFLAFAAVVGPTLVVVGKLVSGLGALFKVIGFLTSAKGIAGLTKTMGRAGLLGVVLALSFALSEGSQHLSDWLTDVIYGTKAATNIKALRDYLGDLGAAAGPVSAKLNDLGVSAADLATAIEAADGNVDLAVHSLIDNNGDLADSINDIANAIGEAAPAMTKEWAEAWDKMDVTTENGRITVVKEAGKTPEDVAAELRSGRLSVDDASAAMMDPMVQAAVDARAAAVAQMKAMLQDLVGLFESDDTLQSAFQDLLDRMADPYTEAERKADIFSKETIKVIRGALKAGDPKITADTAQLVENMLSQIETLEPGALASGEAVPKNLRVGMNREVGGLITWIEKNITHESLLAMTMDEAEQLGFGNLWRYAQGMERARQDKVSKQITGLQNDLRTKLSLNLYQEGLNTGNTLAAGLKASTSAIQDAAYGIGNTMRGGLAIYSEPKASWSPLRGITEWGGNMVKTIAAGIVGGRAELMAAITLAGRDLGFAPGFTLPAVPSLSAAAAGGVQPGSDRPDRTAVRGGNTYVFHLEGQKIERPSDIAREMRRLDEVGLLPEN